MSKYTAEQRSTIEYLINRGKSVHKQMESVSAGTDESEKLQNELNSIKLQLREALNAEAMYRAHLKVAQEHIEAAEAIYKKWCGDVHPA